MSQSINSLFSLRGRLRRRGWWALTALSLMAFIVGSIIAVAVVGSPRRTGDYGSLHFTVVCLSLPFEVVWLTFNVRRIHDLGRAGWWLLPAYALSGLDMALLAAAGWYTPGSALHKASELQAFPHVVHVIDDVVAWALWAVLGLWPGNRKENRFGSPPGQLGQTAQVFD